MSPGSRGPGAVATARGTEDSNTRNRDYSAHCRVCRIPTNGADVCETCARWLAIADAVSLTKRLLREVKS